MSEEYEAGHTVQQSQRQARSCRRMLRGVHHGALGTVMKGDDAPYVSLASVATDHDGSPLFLFSTIAAHTINIGANPQVALFIMPEGTVAHSPQTIPRVTIMGRITASLTPRHRHRFLARHPGAALYADFTDFAFYRLEMERVHFVGGFARAAWLGPVLVSAAAAERMAGAESSLCARMNAEQPETCALYARILARSEEAGWHMTALDVDGFDLTCGERVVRIAFETPVSGTEDAWSALMALAEKARHGSLPLGEALEEGESV